MSLLHTDNYYPTRTTWVSATILCHENIDQIPQKYFLEAKVQLISRVLHKIGMGHRFNNSMGIFLNSTIFLSVQQSLTFPIKKRPCKAWFSSVHLACRKYFNVGLGLNSVIV